MHSSASQVIGIIDIELPAEACWGGDFAGGDDFPDVRGKSSRLPARVRGDGPGSVTIVADTEQLNRDLREEVSRLRRRVAELRQKITAR